MKTCRNVLPPPPIPPKTKTHLEPHTDTLEVKLRKHHDTQNIRNTNVSVTFKCDVEGESEVSGL